MTAAVCFKCGDQKGGPFTACDHCGATPSTEEELSLSLVLCERFSATSQLARFAHEIKNRLHLSAPESLLVDVRKALKDPRLRKILGVMREPTQSITKPLSTAANQSRTPGQTPSRATGNRRPRNLREAALHRNAFWLLGATTRDDRQRIVELAEQKLLELDSDACQKPRSELTNPRVRLGAEMAWLPGTSPRRAMELAGRLLHDPMSVRTEVGLPTLAHANLMAAAFDAVDAKDDPRDIAEFIQELAHLADVLSSDEVMRDINEDRAVSGFPRVSIRDQIESELRERKRYFRNAIRDALNCLPPSSLVDAMTVAVELSTASGAHQAPELIDELVDSYEIETQEFLQKEAENVDKIISAVRGLAKSGEEAVEQLIDKLESVTRNWDKVAQPIQLSAKARGIAHRPSTELAFSIRSVAVDLFKHEMPLQSRRITAFLQDLFSELPEFAERVEEDARALEEIARDIERSEVQRKEWAREITYSAEIGTMFRSTLSISPTGITWKDQTFPLESITRVRWGGVRQSVNGIPVGTNYTIAFGDNRVEAVIALKRKEVFSTFTDKLWRAVGVRLLTDFLQALKSGRDIRVGEALVRDDGVTLIKHKLWGANEHVRCTWYETKIWSADGAFYIASKDDKKSYVALSYIELSNVHILEQAIRVAFQKAGMSRLSDVLSKT